MRAGDLVQVGEGARGEDVLRRAVEIERAAGLHHPALAQQRDAVAHAHGLLGVVGDDDAGGARLVQDGERLLAHLLAQPRIEAGERLVHQQHARPRRDGAGQRHALLLAAGEDVRVFVGVMVEPDAGERGAALRASPPPRVSEWRPKATLSRMVRCGNSAKSWNIRPTPRFSGGTKPSGPATSWPSISTRPEVGRSTPAAILSSVVLPQPERPEQAEDLAGRHVEGDMVEREHLAVAVGDSARR